LARDRSRPLEDSNMVFSPSLTGKKQNFVDGIYSARSK